MTVDLQQATEASSAPGTWWRTIDRSGRVWVSVSCGGCGRGCTLHRAGHGHDIAADGTVTPSLVCPFDAQTVEQIRKAGGTTPDACNWHVFVRLVGWTPP